MKKEAPKKPTQIGLALGDAYKKFDCCTDPQGCYTGFTDIKKEKPIQDADDL